MPERVPGPGPSGADVGVAVVPIDPPGLQDPVCVPLVSRTTDVIHDSVLCPRLQ